MKWKIKRAASYKILFSEFKASLNYKQKGLKTWWKLQINGFNNPFAFIFKLEGGEGMNIKPQFKFVSDETLVGNCNVLWQMQTCANQQIQPSIWFPR